MPQQPSLSNRSASPSSWHPTDYLRVLYKRRWVAIPGFLLVFLTGAMGSLRTVPIYEARTQLLIEKDAKRNTSINSVLEDRDSWYEDDFYPTQQRILLSRTLGVRTATSMEKVFRPEELPAPGAWSFSFSGLVGSAISGVQSLVWSEAPAPAPKRAEIAHPSAPMSSRRGRQHSWPAHRHAGSQLPCLRAEFPVGRSDVCGGRGEHACGRVHRAKPRAAGRRHAADGQVVDRSR